MNCETSYLLAVQSVLGIGTHDSVELQKNQLHFFQRIVIMYFLKPIRSEGTFEILELMSLSDRCMWWLTLEHQTDECFEKITNLKWLCWSCILTVSVSSNLKDCFPLVGCLFYVYKKFSKHYLTFPQNSFNFFTQKFEKKWKILFPNAQNICFWP